MEEKLICIYSGPLRGDCCSHSQYRPRNPMTVRELCEYAISLKDEWGYIGIKDKYSSVFGNPQIEYWHGTYCDHSRKPIELNFPKEILDAQVELVDWDGGWSRGDWLITLAGTPKEEPIREEPPALTKEQKVEARIKSMSNEELERYILETRAKKLMLEEDDIYD